MQKDGKQVKKRQKIVKWVGQLGGKVVIGAAIGIGEKAIKKEGEQDKKALDALFNKIV